MKSVTILTMLLISSLVYGQESTSQMIVGINGGSSNKGPTAGLDFGITIDNAVVLVGEDFHLSDRVSKPAIFSVKCGYSIPIDRFYALPMIGFGYTYYSLDKTDKNTGHLLGRIELGRNFELKEYPVSWFVGWTQVDNIMVINSGLRGYFNL